MSAWGTRLHRAGLSTPERLVAGQVAGLQLCVCEDALRDVLRGGTW